MFLGETGELTDEWNARFRKLNETHGIGWSFWTYKNLDTPSTVVSIPRPDGWNEIVAFADGKRTDQARRGADRLARPPNISTASASGTAWCGGAIWSRWG